MIVQDYYLILFISLPTIFTIFTLFKREIGEQFDSFWQNQKWKVSDAIVIIACLSVLKTIGIFLSRKTSIPNYYLYVYGNWMTSATIIAVMYLMLHDKVSFSNDLIGLSPGKIPKNILIGVFAFGILMLLYFLLFTISGQSMFSNQHSILSKIHYGDWPLIHSIIYFFGVVLVTPLVEETFFRGVLYSVFLKKYGSFGGICATSAIWSAMHLQLKAFFGIFLIGVLLCYLYKKTKSLVPSITLHILKNGSLFFLYGYS